MNVISPTGTVHVVEQQFETDGGLLLTCGYHEGVRFSDPYVYGWPQTDKEVTCKNCLRTMERKDPLVYPYKVVETDDKDHILLFWHGPLSQWWYSPFVIGNATYNCAEQYMMAQKARVFNDLETLNEIMNATGPYVDQKDFNQYPRLQQKLGRKVKNYVPQVWDAVAKDTVIRASMAKFLQDNRLRDFLISTGDTILAEASPYDKRWGIGLSDTNPKSGDISRWRGTNWLGEVLMIVREYIK